MLFIALLADALIGDPDALWRRIPHPVVLMGRLIDGLEARLNDGPFRYLKGAVAMLILVIVVGFPAWLLSLDVFAGIFEIVLAAILLAQKSLMDHLRAVARGLAISLDAGRAEVAKIVGRDPRTLDQHGVARAAIESGAENFSDGVVAPAFWFLVAGLPGIAIYKAINTADSMIGHMTERYREFGWAAAGLDDVANFVPARIAGGIICLVGGGKEAFEIMRRDAWTHRSMNAGWPEAAMAASLGLALAGPRVYAGEAVDEPFLNHMGRREATHHDIGHAIMLLWKAWAVLLGVATVTGLLWLVF